MRKTYLLALAGLAALTLACAGQTTSKTSSGDVSGASSPAASANGAKTSGAKTSGGKGGAATTAKVGQPVRDGKFEFTVTKVKCGVTKVGDEYLNAKAQGQFCLITLRVKNIGKKAQTFSDSNQKGYDASGAQYSADTEAALYANGNADSFLNDINPGNAVTGAVVFDIPKGAKLTRLELHDSVFSGGVTVALS